MTMTCLTRPCAACSLLIGSIALAQDGGDINPAVAPVGDGLWKIVTNAIDENETIIESVRVFPSDFGDGGVPNVTSEPGFDALPGTFQPGTQVGFHAPQGFLAFTGSALEPVTSESLKVKFLSLEVIIGDQPDDGFALNVQADGGWHRHFTFELLSDSPEPAPGIYVLPMTLHSTDPAVLESETFWLVFDHQAARGAQEDAIAWITDAYLAPACPSDLDSDGVTGPQDLAVLLGAWGTAGVAADLDGDGSVQAADLALLLGAWGDC